MGRWLSSLRVRSAPLEMSSNVRRRNREGMQHSEDVMAREPEFDFGASGPHAPFLVPQRRHSEDEEVCDCRVSLFVTMLANVLCSKMGELYCIFTLTKMLQM